MTDVSRAMRHEPPSVVLVIDLRASRPPEGTVSVGGSAIHFAGWIGLISLLARVVDDEWGEPASDVEDIGPGPEGLRTSGGLT